MAIKSETETVVKKILPYLERRGYDIVNDLEFETSISVQEVSSKVFIDILINLGKKNASFLIEAKKLSKKLTNKDRDQAIKYAKSKEINVPFVVVPDISFDDLEDNGAVHGKEINPDKIFQRKVYPGFVYIRLRMKI